MAEIGTPKKHRNLELLQSRNRRAYRRDHVGWPTLVDDQRLLRIGKTCDVSATGLFIRVLRGLESGLAKGDLVRIVCRRHGQNLSLAGVVRWVGFSMEHGADGIGVHIPLDLHLGGVASAGALTTSASDDQTPMAA